MKPSQRLHGSNRLRKIRSRTEKAPATEVARGLELIGYHDTPAAFKHRFLKGGGTHGPTNDVY